MPRSGTQDDPPAWIRRASSSRAAIAGIALMIAGIFLFAVNDALGKWLVRDLYRRAGAADPQPGRDGAACPVHLARSRRPSRRRRAGACRSSAAVLATIEVACFYWAVAYLPLADVMAYYLAGPIFVTAIAGTMLGEPVGWRRWSAVVAGFVGVVVCLRPGVAAFTWPALIALIGSLRSRCRWSQRASCAAPAGPCL